MKSILFSGKELECAGTCRKKFGSKKEEVRRFWGDAARQL